MKSHEINDLENHAAQLTGLLLFRVNITHFISGLYLMFVSQQ